MREWRDRLSQLFREHCGSGPDAVFHAPGRVNLIGEHTDYNQGFVLPVAIDRRTYMAVKTRADGVFRAISTNMGSQASQWPASELPAADNRNPWANYLRGVHEQFLKQGRDVSGMDVVTLGDVPQGAGLSSSASFCVAFATAINDVQGFGLSAVEIALLCQAAENEFVGCNCGIMDQLISAAGRECHALLIDCRDLGYRAIPLPADMAIIIVDSKVTRGLVDSEYNDRRRQCEQAAVALRAGNLREVGMDRLRCGESLMNPVAFRRARHVVSENARTEAAAVALAAGDYTVLSELMAASHISMRDDFAITTPEIDFLVRLIGRILGDQGGVRMTGGGFGGCVVALAPKRFSDRIIDVVAEQYSRETGLQAEIYLCGTSDGAGRIEI
jgi:galactokinase